MSLVILILAKFKKRINDIVLELIEKNKEWLFSGAGAMAIAAIFNLLRNKIKKNAPSENQNKTISVQAAIDNSVNIQGSGNGNISVGSINVESGRIPEQLAKPSFSIKQVGFTGIWGEDPKYKLQILNAGGCCYSAKVRSDAFLEEFQIPKIRRGGSASINVTTPRGISSMVIIIVGFDGNGVEWKQTIHGTNYRDGYKFS